MESPMNKKIAEAFVFTFATNQKYYIYDVNTNSILNVPYNIYSTLKNKKLSILSDKERHILQSLFNQGFFKANPIQCIEHPISPIIKNYLERKVQSITLQITQQCNLRCKYCAYSGEYETRQHAPKQMSFKIAAEAIEFLVNHSIDTDTLNIGFYGGEPLLCFDTVKKIVEFTKNNTSGKEVFYNITTNGTLFNDENIKFMQDNNFIVMISLDGPEEIHNKNRVFASSGKGTFSTIMNNIKKIKLNYPKFYKQLSVNAVVDPTASNCCSSNFFVSCSDIEGLPISASLISSIGRKNAIDINEKFLIDEDVEDFKFMLNKIGRLSSDKISKLSETRFHQMLSSFNLFRPRTTNLPSVMHPSGPCIPGARKLMLDVEGNFYPCESVPETEAMRIGNLKEGFDENKILSFLNIGKISAEECKNCWGIRLCTQCCFGAASNTGLSKKKRLAECSSILKSHENNLKDFCTLREYGYNFSFDILNAEE